MGLAARGADGRSYPWGRIFDWSFLRGRYSGAEPEPADVGSFPADQSVYGIFDLAGNLQEFCDDEPGNDAVIIRGGHWALAAEEGFRSAGSGLVNHAFAGELQGFRVVKIPTRNF